MANTTELSDKKTNKLSSAAIGTRHYCAVQLHGRITMHEDKHLSRESFPRSLDKRCVIALLAVNILCLVSSTDAATTARAETVTTNTGTPIQVQLTGGPSEQEGRLLVLYNGIWGTVCDDSFGNEDAAVVCYMLGFGRAGRFIYNQYGQGSGQIWLDEVQCLGTENSLADCSHNYWGAHDCSHWEDVSISCASTTSLGTPPNTDYPPTVSVRLMNGSSSSEGRLEISYNGVWGTVCSDFFEDVDASVACNMLGYGRSGRVIYNQYGSGYGPIWLDDVSCYGYEWSLVDCGHTGWGVSNCNHYQDVAISCNSDQYPTTASAETVRLANSAMAGEGRLEVYYNGVWGTVCSDRFDNQSASVACYMLGFGRFGRMIYNQYGPGDGPIWLDEVQCSGSELSLSACAHNPWGVHDCSHSQDVSISCIPLAGSVRLANSSVPTEGRLEVYYNGAWGTVCDDSFDNQDASVACNMLGFGHVGRVIYNQYGSGTGQIWLAEVRCGGSESSLSCCYHNGWGVHDCNHSEDVSISCAATTPSSPPIVNVRLADSMVQGEGRLEISYNGVWGTVCDDFFEDVDASVACSMLGLGCSGRMINNQYGPGYGQIWLDDVDCVGSESSLADCRHIGWGVHNCGHSEDVSISCNPASSTQSLQTKSST